MLEPVNIMRNAAQRGFTLIELMVVVALGAIILALAVPSFTSMVPRKRMEGVASELATDIQYARSEAAQRNVPVRVTIGTYCYVITAQPTSGTPTSSCTQTGASTIGAGATELKTVQITSGTSLALTSTNSLGYFEFDPVRGMAIDAGGTDTTGYVAVTNTAGNWQIQAKVWKQGRVKLCSPNGTVTGLATDCN